MDKISKQVAKRFITSIKDELDIYDAIVYGSRARGDFNNESDLDVAIILNDPSQNNKSTIRSLARLGYNYLLENDVLVSPAIFTLEEWLNPSTKQKQIFFQNIRREGHSIWQH